MENHILSNWYSKKRTKVERNSIYNFLRLCGFDRLTSHKVKDWRMSKIVLYIFVRRKSWCRSE